MDSTVKKQISPIYEELYSQKARRHATVGPIQQTSMDHCTLMISISSWKPSHLTASFYAFTVTSYLMATLASYSEFLRIYGDLYAFTVTFTPLQ